MMDEPSFDQMREWWLEEGGDGIEIESDEVVDTWRWGTVRAFIVRRLTDKTYWQATYRVSTDGETHDLRDGEEYVAICQVYPVTVERIEYWKVTS